MQHVHIGHQHPTSNTGYFSNPTSGHHRPHTFVNVLLELVSAEQFDCDSLHVRYSMHLPTNCRPMLASDADADGTNTDSCDADDGSPLAGCTHTAQCRPNGDGIWWLGHTHELNLLCRSSSSSSDSAVDNMLRISYDVVYVDRWAGLEHIVGSAVQTIALLEPCSAQPDNNVHRTQPLLCYQVQTTSSWWWWWPSRFRMPAIAGGLVAAGGQSPPADDGDCKPSSSATSRFGLRTRTTGVLNVRTQIVRQRAVVAESAALAVARGNATSTAMPPLAIDDVIGAYELAKRRLLQQIGSGRGD